ncbi:GNAT family N-acetyltransferase [Saccharothrix algeriensis]|uniref:GNAT family N-acetyltransferase n=1 Tax=Saccharothrix algeriensis TaxID=173560 RepID=A0A8T8I3S0_9PSEU|nr:GNAT family N-acetyltransferase [Saccharothrix algeriensis]
MRCCARRARIPTSGPTSRGRAAGRACARPTARSSRWAPTRWSAADLGFIAGVATRPDHRGRGLSTRVCAFLAGALLAETGGCALMVDRENPAAIRVYERLGFAYRSVSALRAAG